MNARKKVNRDLSILQWNARSITKRLSDFKITLYSTKPHVAAIQETWLKTNKNPTFESYDILRKDRKNKKAGGIMTLIRKNVKYVEKDIRTFPNGKLEVLVITIMGEIENVDIMNIYNPKTTLSEREFLHYKSQLSANFVILGDFNAHHPNWEPERRAPANQSGNTIDTIINDFNNNIILATPPDLPTHINIQNGKNSTIDLTFCPPQNILMI